MLKAAEIQDAIAEGVSATILPAPTQSSNSDSHGIYLGNNP